MMMSYNKFNVKNIKMKKVVRLTESDLARVVRRIINEQPTPGPAIPGPGGRPIQGPGPEMNLPKCNRVMKSDGGPDKPGSGQSLRGPIDRITYNATVSPEYQGYTVHKDGRPFCFIPNR